MKDKLIDEIELGELLRVGRYTIYNMRKRGELPPGVKQGKRWLYLRADIDKWIQAKFNKRN